MDAIGINGDVAGTLDASYFKGCGLRQGVEREVVAYTMVVRSGCDTDSSGRSAGKGALIQTERASTLNTVQDQYLFQPTAFRKGTRPHNTEEAQTWEEAEVSHTLNAFDMKFAQTPELVVEPITIQDQATRFSGKRGDKSDGKGNGLGIGSEGDPMFTLTGGDRHCVAYSMKSISRSGVPLTEQANPICASDYKDPDIVAYPSDGRCYIVRRLTPPECARLQGFADWWGHLETKHSLTDEEYHFWMEVRNTHAAINGKVVREYNKTQMLNWYNKLWTDGAEYKMWGNGIALPPALYCMQGITDVLNREEDDSWML